MSDPRHRFKTSSAGALERLRLLLLVPALLCLALSVVVIAGSGGPPPLRAAGVLGAVALGAHWLRGFRRRRFSAALEPAEALTLLLVLVATPGHPPLPLFATTFRALYGGPVWSALRALALLGTLVGLDLARGTFEPQDQLGKGFGLALAVSLMHVITYMLRRLNHIESRLRAVIQHSTDVVTIVGEDLRIRWQAASIRAVLGHEPSHLHGRPFLELIHPEDAPEVELLLTSSAPAPGAAVPTVARMLDGGGAYRYVEAVIGNRLRDEYIEGFLVAIRDVTERRQLERLRERVEAQRERQELEARLQRSQRLESVGHLAGGVAHDFNNLLTAILNYTAMVRDDLPEDVPAQEDLAEVEDAARRGARLVRQLLLFSQGKLTTARVLNLNAVIEGLDGLLNGSLGSHVRLSYELDPALAAIEADVTNVEQVLVNLVVNARDALEPKGGSVTVSTANVELSPDAAVDLDVAPGAYVRLSVADDGCGMDEETRARALEPFFTTKALGVGTGLGLATVLGIATHAGGRVTIDSAPGAGTAVHVYLPASALPAPEGAPDRLLPSRAAI